jgi:hypothetical protein
MARQRSNVDTYTGRGGQLAVEAELLLRQVNVAIPEVDEGEDVFAFLSGEPDVTRIQVKTANAQPLKEEGRYAARLSVPLAQLRNRTRAKLYYVFAVRLEETWTDFLIISRLELDDLSANEGVGYVNHKAGELQLHLSFAATTLTCSDQDLQPYRYAWHRLPVLNNAESSTGPHQLPPKGPTQAPGEQGPPG